MRLQRKVHMDCVSQCKTSATIQISFNRVAVRPCRTVGVQNARATVQRAVAANAAAVSAPVKQTVEHYIRNPAPWPTDVPIVAHDPIQAPSVDLVIAGAGPSGLAVGERVARAGFKVCIIDPAPLGIWPNNYGVWVDEFEAMGLGDCLEVIWPKAKVFLDSADLGAKPYGRVDRPKLKRTLLERCVAAGVTFISGKVDSVSHSKSSSTVKLQDSDVQLTGTLVLDATGHSRRLVEFDKKFDPGYQGAYGIIAEVESHPFDVDTMLFMDWRDDHLADLPEVKERNSNLPTFLYAMPFTKNKVFLEETSLVARPAVEFPDLKERLEARMKWLGIKVKSIEEEEYCLIPMGGVLPKHPQRVLGIGGTAGMVHPSTGFMVSRMLGVAPTIADAIVDQLSQPEAQAAAAVVNDGAASMAAGVWRAAWPVERLRQRAFFCFGMDVLLKLNLAETRSFFNAFFDLSDFHWHGFLSARLGFLQLIGFGLSLFANSTNEARGNLLAKVVPRVLVRSQ
eukprot:gene7052-7266_t